MNVGCDILYIPRIKDMIESNNSFINKVFTNDEIRIAKSIKVPYNFYATRFAAKEAIIKATNGLFDFNEIEILKGSNGEPLARIINRDDYIINLSLSYDNDYAIAYCIVNKK